MRYDDPRSFSPKDYSLGRRTSPVKGRWVRRTDEEGTRVGTTRTLEGDEDICAHEIHEENTDSVTKSSTSEILDNLDINKYMCPFF